MVLLDRCKHIIYSFWVLGRRVIVEKRRWRNLPDPVGNEIRVFYGHELIPSRLESASGALIKFQDLNDYFPNTVRGANVLYLVSSALPSFPVVMAREAKRKGAIVIINQNGVAYPAWHGPGWDKTNRPMQVLLQLADFVIYQSEFCKLAADTYLGSVGVPWTIMYNPVDTRAFVPTMGVLPGMRILLAGSHHQFYRVRVAIEMISQLLPYTPEVKLSIAGRYRWRMKEEECLQEARQLATELGVASQVEFIGAYTQAEAPSLFQQHHVLLHTQYNDSCPRLLVEAMACGLPIVYSASGGAPELVGDEAGVGVESRLDWESINAPLPQELAAATLKLFASFDRYSRAARKRAVEKFDRSLWVENHQNIITKILKR